MVSRISFLILAGFVFAGGDAFARGDATPWGDRAGEQAQSQRAGDGQIRLAQYREVEVFYDRDGREILLDPYTGEVVAIREPRGGQWGERDPYYEPPRGGGYPPAYERGA